MPFGIKPHCSVCRTSSSAMWKRTKESIILCNSCCVRHYEKILENPELLIVGEIKKEPSASTSAVNSSSSANNNNNNNGNGSKNSKNFKPKLKQTQLKAGNSKGKGRRVLFKKSSMKAPVAVATLITTDSLYYNSAYFQVGDVVSLVDEDESVYYAQIRGLLQDQYCEKSAVITWLIPTVNCPKDYFDPAYYILGPEEEIPRKLSCMEFVCHAPSEYYRAKDSPYTTLSSKAESSFIWTRIGPQIKPLPSQEEVFGT